MKSYLKFISIYFCFTMSSILFSIEKIAIAEKITLFDSTKLKEDLNWAKLSFKETSQSLSRLNLIANDNSNPDLFGWKESSFSSYGGDDVWRIHFVCDLNVQNIQNWLFVPIINTKQAQRITLNLTFTIRECEQFPVKQVVKNCKEKFELYYEEIADDLHGRQETDADYNQTLSFFQNKIKQLRFRETFVSDTGLRYYNSFVDRQQQRSRLSGSESSPINVELREIPLITSIQGATGSDSFIRFAIRDSGACISLLSVEVSYLTCSAFIKHGILFPETSTGRDLTDLIQVNGKCPMYSSSHQAPKAICTAKGEWLITDQNLSTRCLCLPGYEFINGKCIPCRIGYFKNLASNEQKCLPCPQKSWSFVDGAERCECLSEFYRENENDLDIECRSVNPIRIKNIDLVFLDEEKLNISINRNSLEMNSAIKTEIKCLVCNKSILVKEECEKNCLISSFSNDWIVIINKNTEINLRIKLVISQNTKEKALVKSNLFINLNQAKHSYNKKQTFSSIPQLNQDFHKLSAIHCEIIQNLDFPVNSNSPICSNISIDFITELERIYSKYNLIERIKLADHVQLKIYALFTNSNHYQLIKNENSQIKSSFIQLRLVENLNLKHIVSSKNNSIIPLLLCNLYEIDTVKLEISFELNPISNVNDNYEDESVNISINDEEINSNSLDLFAIEVKLSNNCVKKEDSSQFQRDFIDTNTQKMENIQSSSSNYKVHIVLPIVLSFFLVSMVIIVTVFLRRSHLRRKEGKGYTCNNHMMFKGKFMPKLSKSSSSKCINCSSNSSSSSTSSTSPSTTCTTSQIIENSSKLYYVDPHTYEDPALAIQEFAQEIAPLDIKIESVIGGGEFGDVCKGKLKNINNVWLTVAIKTLKVGSSEKNRCDFLTEASIMAQFHHENIICLEGVVTQSHPYMIITEYMDNGSLDTFLRLNSWRLEIVDLVKILKDIASGMKYLAEMNFVHRDLAARNILVNKSLKCKVADFGLSREIEGESTEGVYWTKGGKIPVRWTAPEAISHTKFTCSSDVWSFGVTMWEVMSYGERPYWNWSNTDVIKSVEKGFRLMIPTNCPHVLYSMMLNCWENDRLKRPKFKQIVNDLDSLTKSKMECLFILAKKKQNTYIDTNRPNFTQLTNIQEWLNSLNLMHYADTFINRRYLNLSQIINLEKDDLLALEIRDGAHIEIILESLKCINFELNFQNGFLV